MAADTTTKPPPPDAALQSEADLVRGAAKWLLASLGAVATVLVAGLQFSAIGAVPSGQRAVAAVLGAALALGGVVFLIALVFNVMVPADVTLDQILDHKRGRRYREYIHQNPSVLLGFESITALVEARREAVSDAHDADTELHRVMSGGGSAEAVKAAEDASTVAGQWATHLASVTRYVVKRLSTETLRRRLDAWHRLFALLAATIAGAGIGLYAWGTNAPKAAPTGPSLRGAVIKHANLRGANLTNADLTGATLTGSVLAGVTWSNTTCPDGTNSDNDGKTCVGHLHPAR